MSAYASTRRQIIAGAATLPLAITLSTTSSEAAPADHPIVTIGEQLIAALDDHSAACTEFGAAEDAMFAWHKRNPKPVLADWRDGDRQAEREVVAAYEAATKAWAKSKRAAQAQCRYDIGKVAERSAIEKVGRLLQVLADTPASGMGGLAVKARLADRTGDAELAWAVVQDIMAMG